MVLWIPRSSEDSANLTTLCHNSNIPFYCLPVLRPTYFPPCSLPPKTTRLLITSSHGLRSCQSLWTKANHIPLYTVGTATADRARQLGIQKIFNGPGTIHELLEMIQTQEDESQTFFYPRGRDITAPLQSPLESLGHILKETIVYQMDPLLDFSQEEELMLHTKCSSVLTFSPRMTQILIEIAKKYNLPTEQWSLLGTSRTLEPAYMGDTISWKNVISFSKIDRPTDLKQALRQL